ncbi:NosD domain-containing protein [Natronorubrum halophilum]|uniref:NosD domain-containing protein n=1 Tax=Natronorubrum halophilum TaxID=1702106 RepID=UPI0010C1B581|nr:right-handed parallel beta-helix repeat-containing protein [Natronorubrum halophilum]
MQRRFGVGLGVLGILLVVLIGSVGGVSAADSCTEISGPLVIDQPGCYAINESVADSSADVYVEIRSSDVILEGANHTIDGSDGFDTIGVYVNGTAGNRLSNVTVRNISADDWETGIYYDYVDNSVIHDVSSASNYEEGIQLRNSNGIAVTDSDTAENPTSDQGMLVFESTAVTITNFTSVDDGSGIRVWNSQDVTVHDSTFDGSAAVTIRDSGGVLVDDNTIVDGSLGGITGSIGPANRVTNNSVYESSMYATGADCGGMTINGASGDLIANNTMEECNWGILIQHSERIEFRNNSISGTDGGNSDYGLRVSGGSGHEIIDNHIVNNGRYPKRAGIFLGTHQATLSGNTLAGNGFNLDLGSGGNWSSLSHSIDASNTVEGRPVAYHVNETDVTVDPNAGWVGLVGTQNATVANMNFTENNWENIMLFEADDTVVRNVDTMPSWSGVRIREGSDRTRIEDSRFNYGRGITLFQATKTQIVNTSITNSGGYGVYLNTDSPDTTLENATISGSDRRGIAVRSGSSGSDRLTVRNSTVRDNDWGGLDFDSAAHGVVRDSVIENNGGDAIRADRYVHNTTITRNTIANNDGDGVDFDHYAEDNNVTDNEIKDNTGNGVYFGLYQESNHVVNNTISGNDVTGIRLNNQDSDDSTTVRGNRILENTITDNVDIGIDLGTRGFGDIIRGNELTGNAIGVEVPTEYDNLTVSDNSFNNAANVVFLNATGATNATWNATTTTETNVIGGPTVGGNYWANESATGFSETCTDRGDGICDSAYTLETGHTDHLPLAAPADGVDPAYLDVSIDSTNSPVEANETLEVNATITNTGDESGTQTIALDLDGTDVDDQSVTLDGGDSATVTLSYVTGDADVGQYTATVTSENDSDSLSVEVTDGTGDSSSQTAIVNSITATGGTTPSQLPHVETSFEAGLLQLTLRSSEHGEYNLESLNVDHTTEFEIDLTVENYEPRVLLGAGNVTNWERTENGTNTTDVSIRVRPVETQSIRQCDGTGTCTAPDLNDWPEGDDDSATERTNVTVSMAVDDLSDHPTDQQTLLDGAIIATDAQLFDEPLYTPAVDDEPANLSLLIGGPHFTVDNQTNTGFYEAFLPDTLLSEWNVTDPTQLTAVYRGNQSAFDARNVSGGIEIDLDVHYSAGSVEISTNGTNNGSGGDGADDSSGEDGPSSGDSGSNTSDDEDDTVDDSDEGDDDSSDDDTDSDENNEDDGSNAEDESENGTDSDNESEDTDGDDGDGGDADDTPGFGAVAGIIALLIALAARTR